MYLPDGTLRSSSEWKKLIVPWVRKSSVHRRRGSGHDTLVASISAWDRDDVCEINARMANPMPAQVVRKTGSGVGLQNRASEVLRGILDLIAFCKWRRRRHSFSSHSPFYRKSAPQSWEAFLILMLQQEARAPAADWRSLPAIWWSGPTQSSEEMALLRQPEPIAGRLPK